MLLLVLRSKIKEESSHRQIQQVTDHYTISPRRGVNIHTYVSYTNIRTGSGVRHSLAKFCCVKPSLRAHPAKLGLLPEELKEMAQYVGYGRAETCMMQTRTNTQHNMLGTKFYTGSKSDILTKCLLHIQIIYWFLRWEIVA